MLSRLANILGYQLLPSEPTRIGIIFRDSILISNWAVTAVEQMHYNGIMGGTGNGNFSPQGIYTIEQSIVK